MIYQFTVKPWNQKSWPKQPEKELLCKDIVEAQDIARTLAIKNRADVRYKIKGFHKLHYYRVSDVMKKKLIANDQLKVSTHKIPQKPC